MRIIAGTARGCRLKTLKGERTRPTADRIKESLFSILAHHIQAARVLDLFAGTGALGLEALSRGARSAIFVDEKTAFLIKENAVKTRLFSRAVILRSDAFSELKRLFKQGYSFDLIFCDPPYRRGLWEKALSLVDKKRLLTPDGCMIVEQGAEEVTLPTLENLSCTREEIYGKTTRLCFFHRKSEEAAFDA